MFNVAVINVKDLIKYLVGLILAILLLIILTRYFSWAKKSKDSFYNLKKEAETIAGKSYTHFLDGMIPGINETSEEINEKEESHKNEQKVIAKDVLESLLQIELLEVAEAAETVETTEVEANEPSNEVNDQNKEEKIVQKASTDVTTEVVTPNPIDANPTDTYGSVQIRNQTGYVLSEDILTPNIEINNSNIIIFHTHTCESYTPTEQNQYEASGTYRTIDLNHSVARVGDELENYLTNFGYNVVHDKTYHDYPAYTGSYARSLKTVETIKQNNNADVIIDLHRDAIGSNNNYAPTVKIGEEYAAQLMFVIGTDGGGLWHPNWNNNLKFAIKVQQKAEEMYPGLFKPIIVRNSRYNQHVSKAASIIEVGATGNTLEECLTSMKYLSKVLSEVVR